MAIDRVQWKMILEAKVTGKALSAGYPDLLLTAQDIPTTQDLPIREDTEKAQRHHGWKSPMADSVAVFKAIGLELFIADRAALQGSEFIIDLNASGSRPHWSPYDTGLEVYELDDLGEYDLVIDPGTSEHCFNIAQALINLAGAVKVGGVISQALPMAMFNHGYWNINPVALLDFYELNGFQIERMVIRHPGGVFEPKVEERGKRMKGVPDGAVNIILAHRLEKKPFTWPQQKL